MDAQRDLHAGKRLCINEILFDIENGYELELGSSFDKIIKQLQKGETVTVWKQTMACSFPKRYRLKESD
jgi:hypothetical protein